MEILIALETPWSSNPKLCISGMRASGVNLIQRVQVTLGNGKDPWMKTRLSVRKG